MLLTVFLVSSGALLWVFLGYPLLLRLIVRLRGPRPVARADIEPSVSLVISAYNEAAVLRDKIENALALDYPADKLEIAVVSDASTDGTDDIARGYAHRGVKLFRQDERRGKTAGLNRTLPLLRGDVVVFSDANAMYEPDAIRKLVRNFADPAVGCVTGEARYRPAGRGAADAGESAYWKYELQIKRLETAVGSSVGGDGAIYAIRRHLWKALPEAAINDFLNPLQIVAAGWRSVYEPEAVCWEETAGGTGREYRRRVRIVSRSWRAVFQAPQVLNPFRVGFFALSVVSHKVLRWFTGVFAASASLAVVGLALTAPTVVRVGPVAWAALLLLLLLVLLLTLARTRRLLALAGYFVVLNVASIVGVIRGSFGFVSGTWAPPRAQTAAPGARAWVRPVVVVALLLVAGLVSYRIATVRTERTMAFWASIGVLAYVYVGFPAALAVWRSVARRPTRRDRIEPTVSVLVAAHNEEIVIAEKLRNLLALDYPRDRLELVVASDGSVDRTNEIVAGFASDGVRLVALLERRGKIAAINAAMPAIASEIVVLSDANAFLEPDALRALVDNFADAEVGAVSGNVVLVGDRASLAQSEDLYYRYERWLQAAESEIGSMVGADGALYAIRRELFVPPPDDTILDDMFIPIAVTRQGRRVVFEPGALAFEQGSRSAFEEFSRKSRVVAGAVQLVERSAGLLPWGDLHFMFVFLSHKLLRWLSPLFAVVAVLASAGLAHTADGYMGILALQLAFLALGLLGCLPGARRFKPIAMAHYFWLVQGAAVVGLARGLAGRQPARWRRFARTPVGSHPAPRIESPPAADATRGGTP